MSFIIRERESFGVWQRRRYPPMGTLVRRCVGVLHEFYYQGAGELWSLAATQIPPYGNFGAKVCRGVAIKRGHL
nr:MAG TPA: hypothetical protein [Caudoviricetes sp.]